jgi:hypothetical protein
LQRKELEKFIEFKVDNRSERMGVIHDDAVTNVNRKTLAGETCARDRISPQTHGVRSSGVQKFRRPVKGERIEDEDEHDCIPKIRQNFPIWDRSSNCGAGVPAPFFCRRRLKSSGGV